MGKDITINKPTLGVLALMMIVIASVLSLRGIVLMSEYGLFSILLYAIVAITFYIPTALIAAELATGWPYEGGMYVWSKAAFGSRTGFFMMWLLWVVRATTYPVLFSFIAGTIAFAFKPELANNNLFIYCVTLFLIWAITFMNLFGTRVSGWITTLSALFGSVIPILLIMVLGGVWLFNGSPVQINFNWHSAVAPLSSWSSLALLAGLYLMFGGAEFCGIYANDVKSPKKSYPRALMFSTVILLAFCAFATLSVAMVVPQKDLSLVAGLMQGFQVFLSHYHLEFLVPIMAILIAVSLIGAVNNLICGTSKGLIVTAGDGFLPDVFRRHNRHNAPVNLLLAQAVLATILSTVFIYLPNVNSSYWAIDDSASQLSLVYYIIFFLTWGFLRKRHPNVERTYTVPGGKPIVYGITIVGILACLFVLAMSYIPPSQFKTGSPIVFVGTLLVLTITFCLIPFVIFWLRRKHIE